MTYHGKYRGTVINPIDPDRRGRIQVAVPDVTGASTSTWALPCVPNAEDGHGLLVVPQPGASVWVEYEYGDPDRPIWTGCFWDSGASLPTSASFTPGTRGLAIELDRTRLTLSADRGADGGITLATEGGAKVQIHRDALVLDNAGARITLDQSGLTLEHTGTITLKVGNTTLTIATDGITLACGASKIAVTSAQVDVNSGALTVV
jgi:uncharacterized protein involved in type VI secretion and phage assembly